MLRQSPCVILFTCIFAHCINGNTQYIMPKTLKVIVWQNLTHYCQKHSNISFAGYGNVNNPIGNCLPAYDQQRRHAI